jgi:hypothetical protein
MADIAKVTVELDADDVAKARARLGAAPGEPDAAVVQRVLNGYLLKALLDEVNARSDLSEEEAMEIALEEQRAVRASRRAAG